MLIENSAQRSYFTVAKKLAQDWHKTRGQKKSTHDLPP